MLLWIHTPVLERCFHYSELQKMLQRDAGFVSLLHKRLIKMALKQSAE